MAQYGSSSYWDERYTKEADQTFDWYQRWAGVKRFVELYARPTDNVLMVGCGNSRLSDDMYQDGYHNITNIDISPVVIDTMSRHNGDRSMKWMTMDVRHLLPEWTGKFDVAIDKGTMDAILCGEGSTSNVHQMCQQMSRVLRPGGTFIMISYGAPDHRLCYLENREYGWGVRLHTVAKNLPKFSHLDEDSDESSNVHYIYACQKFGSKPEPPAATIEGGEGG